MFFPSYGQMQVRTPDCVYNYALLVPLMSSPPSNKFSSNQTSRPIMSAQSCIDFWKDAATNGLSIWDRLAMHKHPVIEPRDSATFAVAAATFKAKIDDPASSGAAQLHRPVCCRLKAHHRILAARKPCATWGIGCP